MPINIEDDLPKLKRLEKLLKEYEAYIYERERQPMGSNAIRLVRDWVSDNIKELSE